VVQIAQFALLTQVYAQHVNQVLQLTPLILKSAALVLFTLDQLEIKRCVLEVLTRQLELFHLLKMALQVLIGETGL
jgi:hypothetical protein